MPAATPITVWESLQTQGTVVAGAVPFIDPTTLQPAVDDAGMHYDDTNKEFQLMKLAMEGSDAGAAGNVTINKSTGTVLIAAAGQEITLTNDRIQTDSIVLVAVMSDDTTAKSAVAHTVAAGSCKIKLNAAATAQTKVGFVVMRRD